MFFIKTTAVNFHLVHRSQQEPLIADETEKTRIEEPEAYIEFPSAIENLNAMYEDYTETGVSWPTLESVEEDEPKSRKRTVTASAILPPPTSLSPPPTASNTIHLDGPQCKIHQI